MRIYSRKEITRIAIRLLHLFDLFNTYPYSLAQRGDGLADARQDFRLRHQLRNVEHVRPTARPYHRQAEGIHDISKMIPLLSYPILIL